MTEDLRYLSKHKITDSPHILTIPTESRRKAQYLLKNPIGDAKNSQRNLEYANPMPDRQTR